MLVGRDVRARRPGLSGGMTPHLVDRIQLRSGHGQVLQATVTLCCRTSLTNVAMLSAPVFALILVR